MANCITVVEMFLFIYFHGSNAAICDTTTMERVECVCHGKRYHCNKLSLSYNVGISMLAISKQRENEPYWKKTMLTYSQFTYVIYLS